MEKEKHITSAVLIWLGEAELKKWNNKLRRFSKSGQDTAGIDCELLDLDVLLGLYLE